MNTLFEQELRDLFGDGTIVHKPIFIGRTCFGTLGGDLRVRIEFDDPAVLRNYDSLSVKVINRLSVSVKAESGLKSQSRYEILILEESKDFSRILILGRSRERWVRVN